LGASWGCDHRRPYRLEGGRWTEVDSPELIAYKNERLPEPDPADLFTRSGYRPVDRISIPGAAVRAGLPPRIPVFVLKTLMRTLRRGYTAAVFDVGEYR